jgi:hypothetical protein
MEDLVQLFCINSGVDKPDVICLPIYDEGGAQFDSPFTSKESSMWPRYSLEKEVQKIRKSFPNTEIYFSFMPTLPGVKASHLMCRNQYGEETANGCIVNPHVQKVVFDILSVASTRFAPDGIVLGIIDLHGQNSRGEGKPVDISCFCYHCREAMLEQKFDPAIFSQRVSPLNLVLSATETGIRFITPKARFSPEQLVDLAIKDEFVKEDNEQTRRWAQVILDYIRVRSKITGTAVGEFGRRIKAAFPKTKVGAIINTLSFDWVGGVDLHGLAGQVDEVWLDIEDAMPETIPPNLSAFAYSADRARYRINAFFEFVSDRGYLEQRSRRGTLESTMELLRDRLVHLGRVQNLSKTFVDSVQQMDYLAGFVGIPFDRKIYQQITQTVREEFAVMIADVQEKSPTVSNELIRKYISLLVKYREEGNELNRREIVGFAAQLNLIE